MLKYPKRLSFLLTARYWFDFNCVLYGHIDARREMSIEDQQMVENGSCICIVLISNNQSPIDIIFMNSSGAERMRYF